jgi:undecaprenyl-diphosphatase
MFWEALALGALQGLTEFLPISSSAHLALLPWFFGWTSPLLNSLAFDVALHLGTLLAVVLYFWRDIWVMLRAWVRGLAQADPWSDPASRLAWFIILATIPAVLAGLSLGSKLEIMFRAPAAIAGWLIAAGLLLAAAEHWSAKAKTLADMNWLQALGVGVAQALALLPGVSRSGVSISAGLLLGFRREDAARFSFLLALPAVAGACILKFPDLIRAGHQDLPVILAGIVVSALVGWACIAGLLAYLRRRSLYVFVWYRLALGAAVLIWVLK